MPEDKKKKKSLIAKLSKNKKESLRDKKKRARAIREGKGVQKNYNKEGKVVSESTHIMEDDIIGNTSGEYHVNPSIAPDGKGGYKKQGWREARDKGEEFSFKKKKQAAKFAAGSWKKGKAKRESMKKYRKSK